MRVQNPDARFLTCDYRYETVSMASILENMKWESQVKEEENSCCSTKGLKNTSSITKDDRILPLGVVRVILGISDPH